MSDPRPFAFTARAAWLDDDGRDRCPPLATAAARSHGATLPGIVDFAFGRLEVAHETLNGLEAGYPPLEEADVTVNVKPVR